MCLSHRVPSVCTLQLLTEDAAYDPARVRGLTVASLCEAIQALQKDLKLEPAAADEGAAAVRARGAAMFPRATAFGAVAEAAVVAGGGREAAAAGDSALDA